MNDFEKNIGRRLRQYKSDVPESVWQNIEEELPKKRKPVLWLWMAIGVLIFISFSQQQWNNKNYASENLNISEKIVSPKIETLENEIKTEDGINQIKNTESSKNSNKKLEPIQQKERKGLSVINKKINNSLNTPPNLGTLNHKVVSLEKKNKQEVELIDKIPSINSMVKKESKLNLQYPTPPIDVVNKQKSIFIEFLIGPNYHNQVLSAKKSNFEYYRLLRDTTESERMGWSSSIRISKIWKSGITLKSGLNYTLLNKKFDWEANPITRTSFSEGIQNNETGHWTKTTWNRFHHLEIPLLIGYEKNFSKWKLGVSTGPMFNIWFHHKGDIISPGRRPVDITKNKEGAYLAFKNRTGVSLYSSGILAYKINAEIQLLMEPHIRFQLENINQENYLLNQRNISGGIMLGIRKTI